MLELTEIDGITALSPAARAFAHDHDISVEASPEALVGPTFIETLTPDFAADVAARFLQDPDFDGWRRGGLVAQLLDLLDGDRDAPSPDDAEMAAMVAVALERVAGWIGTDPVIVPALTLERAGLNLADHEPYREGVALTGSDVLRLSQIVEAHAGHVQPPTGSFLGDLERAFFDDTIAEQVRSGVTRIVDALPTGPGLVEAEREPVDNIELGLLGWLHPTRTLIARFLGRLGPIPVELAEIPHWIESRNLDPMMSEPRFSAPLWEPLKRYDKRWLLPGLEQFEHSDIVSALISNPRFIEAFLVGANHEVARELLWRGFPTDQRSTPLRAFWTMDDELTGGIRDFDAGPLGTHADSSGIGVVMLFRGELIRRFGQSLLFFALPYAGKDDNNGRPRPQFDEAGKLDPAFVHFVEPDIALAGFRLTAPAARDQRYWFGLSEHVTEPRFGLDATSDRSPPENRDDLAWTTSRPQLACSSILRTLPTSVRRSTRRRILPRGSPTHCSNTQSASSTPPPKC